MENIKDNLSKWFIFFGLVIVLLIIVFWLLPVLYELGLPAYKCPYKTASGYSCLFCGLITSFTLIVRGDIKEAISANILGVFLFLSMIIVFVIIGLRLLVKSLKGGKYGS